MSRLETTGKPLFVLALGILGVMFSGCIDSPGDGVKVITLGASDFNGHIAEFSGSGPLRDWRIKPEVVAPGVDVVSTVPLGLENHKYLDTYYAKASGTSLAASVGSGVAALLLQKDPSLSPAGVKAALVRGARKLNNTLGEDYEPYYQGAGLIDANRSIQIISSDLCGVNPDRWIAGRWAFPAGSGSSSPGVNVGADRAQKKIYALAPGDMDWTNKFVFFTNRELRNVTLDVTGDVARWITIMPLPEIIPANGHNIFAASVAVPNGSQPGANCGAIVISENGSELISVPVKVEVARHLVLDHGSGSAAETLNKNQWHYYYIDVPVATRNLTTRLSWPGASDLDLKLLSPSGECYWLGRVSKAEEISISDPVSGRWLLAVHAKSISSEEKYFLEVEALVIEVDPGSLDMGLVSPGEAKTEILKEINGGIPLKDLKYKGYGENRSTVSFQGEVSKTEVWEKTFNVEANVSHISLNLFWKDKERDLDLKVYDPSGNLADSSEGSENVEKVEIYNPISGKWTVRVKAYKVPRDKSQPFDLIVTKSSLDTRQMIQVKGPSSLESGEVGSISVGVKVPAVIGGQDIKGHLEIQAHNYSVRVPVTFTVAGASIKGISRITFNDREGDGLVNTMTLGVNVKAGVPGIYKVQGAMSDCSGRMILWLSNSSRIDHSGVINLDVDGREIWKKGGCGPLRVGELLLYNPRGELICRYNVSQLINRAPSEFQPPAAFFNGSCLNLSETKQGVVTRIAVGFGVSVFKRGTYWVWASLQDDDENEIATYERTIDLSEGNHTVIVEFNPTRIDELEDKAKLHLRDLTLTLDNENVDKLEEAWSSGEMSFGV